MNGRSLVRLLFVLILGFALAAPATQVMAQGSPEAGGENPFAELGLPQIDITMTDDGFEGVPGELEAGRYVVSLANDTSSPDMNGGTFMQLPEGMTADDLMPAGPPMATPGMDMAPEGSPPADGGPEGIPAWFYEAGMAGGPFAAPGETGHAVIELTAGDWIFWAEDPTAPQPPVSISVTGEIPADAPTPTADVRAEMSEFDFSLDADISAGPVVIELANVGQQPHFMLLATVPDGTTEDDVLALIESMFMGGESPAATPEGALAFEDVADVFNHGNQSAGTTAWYATNLDAGTHVAICFIPDPETGMPHVMLGMIEVFEVS